MTKSAAATTTIDVLVFQRGVHRFAIDATTVSFVHDVAPDGHDVPLVDMATLVVDAPTGSRDRAVRVADGDDVFDLRAGSQLRVLGLDRGSLRDVPVWLAGIAAHTALRALSFSADDVTWLLDVHALAKRARRTTAQATR